MKSKLRKENIRKLEYGRKQLSIRNEILRIERNSRSKTGLKSDHEVSYQNHPYDSNSIYKHTWNHERELSTGEESLFRPLRIRYFTEAMQEQKSNSNGAAIKFLENVVLPHTAEFWSSALSVVPVDGNLLINEYDLSNRMYCGDSEFSLVPESHLTEGVPNADLVWYVSATPSTRFCGTNTLAVAVACNFDQFDRPTAGAINFCLDQVELDADGTASPAVTQDNFDIAIHEAAHILAMSSNAFRYFYDSETGKPRTSRPFQSQTVTCVDGVERTLGLPAENTLEMGTHVNGQRFATIVTPRVQAVVRNHFNCQSMKGAQLENQPTGSESCIGDHWEERNFYPEALTSVMSPTTNVLSPLTLALMEDSGWYVANYSKANLVPWGHGLGCDFVEQSCLTQTSDGKTAIPSFSQGYFCNAPNSRGCSSGQTHKMACTVLDYSLYYPPAYPPKRFQYFSNSDTLGGPEEIDYCPVYGSTYSGLKPEQLECANAANIDNFNLFSEFYGEGSKCFETNTGSGRCYLTQCVRDPPGLRVNIRGTWYNCEEDFQQITFKTNSAGLLNGILTCPRLSSACPDLFCPVNCAGRGVCDYDHVANDSIHPTCKCFNSSTESPCTDSYIPKGDYLLEESWINPVSAGFFDPLISVFVDSPQTWDTTTWAWGAGVLAVFLIMILCICYSFCPDRNPRKGKKAKRRRRR